MVLGMDWWRGEIISIVVCLALGLSGLTGCGKNAAAYLSEPASGPQVGEKDPCSRDGGRGGEILSPTLVLLGQAQVGW